MKPMTRFDIELSWVEMLNACMTGVYRRIKAILQGTKNQKISERGDFQIDIDGAIAEACFCKHRDWHWPCSVGTFKLPDVHNWQVKSTHYQKGHLVVRPNDKSLDEYYALVIVDLVPGGLFGGSYVGWMQLRDIRQEKYLRDDGSSWVPQPDLHDAATMPNEEKQHDD